MGLQCQGRDPWALPYTPILAWCGIRTSPIQGILSNPNTSKWLNNTSKWLSKSLCEE